MKEAKKFLSKKVVALMLVVAMVAAYLPAGVISQAATNPVVSFKSVVSENGTAYVGAPLQNKARGGYINLGMTCGFENGRGSGYGNMVTTNVMQSLYDTGYLTVGGGLTIDDLKTGLYGFVVANATTYQLNWQNRTEGFADGATFTLKKGALLPYVDGSGNATMELDADYTFKFKATTNANYWNEVEITRTLPVAVGAGNPGGLAQWGNGTGTDGSSNLQLINADGVTGYTTKYQRIDNEAYAEYIDFAGIDVTRLNTEYGANIQYILDGSNKLLQINWGTLRDVLKTGDQIVFKKGMPIPYMVGTVHYTAFLDADYVFQVVGSNTDNAQVFRGTKYDPTVNQFALTTRDEYTLFPESNILKANIGFTYTDSTSSVSGPSTNVLAGNLVKDYVEFSSCTLDEVNATDARMLYIASANVLQFEYNDALKAILKSGDTFTLKKGMPVIIDNNGLVTASLADTYRCTMTDTGIKVAKLEEFSATGDSYQVSTEGETQYMRFQYTSGQFTDFPNGEKDLTAANANLYNYISVGGVTGEALKTAGYYFKIYKPNNTFFRLYKSGTDFPIASGTEIIFKQGLPVEYTASSVLKQVVLDKDYGFRYDGTNYVYDASLTFPDAPVAPTAKEYGVTLQLNTASGGNENGVRYWDSAIIGRNVAYTSYDWGTVADADKDTFIDWSHVTNPDVVKAGTTVKMILASDSTKIIRVLFTDAAITELKAGDYLTLKKGMPLITNNNKVETVLDKDYEVNIASKTGSDIKLNFTIPGGTFALNAAGATVQGPESNKYYLPFGYGEAYFADMAAGRQVADFVNIQSHIEVQNQTSDQLSANGWDIQLLHSEARQFRVRYATAGMETGAIVLLKAGLPMTYTTTDGVYKTAHLDKTYGYTYDGTKFTYDASLTEIPTVIVPDNHTPNLPSDYIPADATVLTSGGSFDNDTFGGFVKDGAFAVADGMLKVTYDGSNYGYVQTSNFEAVKGHKYVLSYYIWVEDASSLYMDMFSKGLGAPVSHDVWTDQLSSKASANNFTVTLDGEALTSGIRSNTEGWKLVRLEWTAAASGTFFIGAVQRYGGTGTVYVDDLVLYDATKEEDKGTFTIKAGEWVNTSYNDDDGYHTNLPLTDDSLVDITTNAYWWATVDYTSVAKDFVEFGGLTASQMSDYKVKMTLIKGADRNPLVFQIVWGTSLENMSENPQITLKKGLPIQYKDETTGAIYTVRLSDDYTLTFKKNADSTNGLSVGTLKHPADLLIGDLDGNDSITANDVEIFKRLLLGTLSLPTNIGNVNESADGEVNAADLVWMIKHEGDKLSLNHQMTETINAANAMANSVQIGYNGSANAAVTDGNNAASSYTIDNDNMSLTHSLTNTGTVTSLTNSAGVNYLAGGSMTPFATRNGTTLGESDFETDTKHAARANTTVMGYYYDSTYIRDLNWRWTSRPSGAMPWSSAQIAQVLWLEKGYHTYSDKMYQTYRLVSGGYSNHSDYDEPTAVEGLTNFGFDFKLPLSNINTWEIATASSTQQNVTYTTATSDIQYVAIDTKNAGVIGLIFAGENQTGSQVTVESDGTNLVIRQIVTQANAGIDGWTSSSITTGTSVEFGHRLYTDDTHDFAGIRRANYEEQNPLTEANFTVDGVDSSTFEGYNYRKGYYDFTVDGYDFGEAKADPDKKFFANIKAIGGDDDRMAYICVGTPNELEGATVMDASKVQLPIPMQVNKNFGNENEEPIYAPEGGTNYKDFIHGEIFMPLVMEAGKTQEFSILNVMQNWGNYPVKQISSIEYYTSYYHLSTGVMETNCIAPFGAAVNKDVSYQNNDFYDVAWFLPDFRGISGGYQYGTSGEVQRNSVGTVYAPTADGGKTMHTYTGSNIISAGLTHADLDYTYKSNDGKYDIKMTHVEMPQTDESRTYYTIEFTFNGDTTLDQNFNIIGIGSRGADGKGNYNNAAYLAPGGVETAVTPRTSGSQSYTLNEGSSYFTFYNITDTAQENGNGAVIVKDYEINQAAGTATGLAFLNSSLSTDAWGNINYGALILNGSSHTFKAGDSIKVNVILLSYGMMDQTHYNNVKNVYADTVTNPITVTATTGTVDTAEDFLPTVIAKGNRAEFTLSGGTSANTPSVNYTVKVQGFTSLQRPVVYEKVNGEWQLYEYASFSGYDGYSVQMEDGRLTYSFVVTKGTADRTFKVTTREEVVEKTFGFTGADLKKFDVYQLTVGDVEADGAVTLTTSHADPYVYKYHMDFAAPASQKILVKAKVSSTVTQLGLFIVGDYTKDGVFGTNTMWSDAGSNYYVGSSQCTDAGDGYKIFTFDISSKGMTWSKITGLRLGFNGTGTMTVKEITGQ